MNRREVLEHLVQVWGVRDSGRLRRLTRDYLRYQQRRFGPHPPRPRRAGRGRKTR